MKHTVPLEFLKMVTTERRPERTQVDFVIEYEGLHGQGWMPTYSSIDHEYMLAMFRELKTTTNRTPMRLVQRIITFRYRKKATYKITVLREFLPTKKEKTK